MRSDSIQVAMLVTDMLDKMGIPYAIGGSLSSSLHGVMRSTLDVDILADVHLEHIQPLQSQKTNPKGNTSPSGFCYY